MQNLEVVSRPVDKSTTPQKLAKTVRPSYIRMLRPLSPDLFLGLSSGQKFWTARLIRWVQDAGCDACCRRLAPPA